MVTLNIGHFYYLSLQGMFSVAQYFLPFLIIFNSFASNCSRHFQKEISIAADAVVAAYLQSTPATERTTLEVWEVMKKAQDRMVKSIRAKNFEKYVSVANKHNGDAFFDEVRFHSPLFLHPFAHVCLTILPLSFHLSFARSIVTFLSPRYSI